MLDVDQRALALGALHHSRTGVAGEDGVFGVILGAAAVVGMAVQVHAGADDDGQVEHQRAFAQRDLAHFVRQFLIPAVRDVLGCGADAGAVIVISGIGVRLALIAALGQIVRVGAVGAVIGGVLHQAHRVNVLDVVEGMGRKVQKFFHGHLVDQLFPAGIVKIRALQVADGQRAGGITEHQVGGIIVGAQLNDVIGQQDGQAALGGQAGDSLGEGAVPVAAAQVGDRTGQESIDIHGIVALAERVGNLHARLAHREGVRVHAAVPGPGVGLGGIAVGGHSIGNGLALRRQDVVQRVVGIIADSKVVIARLHNVGFGVLAVVAGEVRQIHRHGDGLAFAGVQGAGLFVVHQLHSGFFDVVLTVVIGIGGAGIQLHHSLAGHVAGVGGGHGDGGGLFVAGHHHLIQRLFKAGIGQAVAEGVHHFVVVCPYAVRLGHRAVRIRIGARGSVCAAVAQHDISIAGLVIAVAGVDAFALDQVRVHIGALAEVGSVGPGNVAVVLHGGRQRAVFSERVAQMRGGRNRAVQHIGHAVEAIRAGEADPQDGVNLGVVLQVGDLHGIGGVDQHNDLVEIGFGFLDHCHFLVAQAQDVAGHGGNAFGQTRLAGIIAVAALAADTAHHHDGRVAVLAVCAGEIGVQRGQLVHGQLTGVAVGRDLSVRGQDAAAELGRGPGLIREERLIRGQSLGVQPEAALGECVKDLDGGFAVRHAAAVVAVHGRVAADAQHGDFGIAAQRQGVIVVFQQGKGLLRGADGKIPETLVGLLRGLEFGLIVPGVLFIVRGFRHCDGTARSEKRIHRGAVGFQDAACHHGYGRQQRAYQCKPTP